MVDSGNNVQTVEQVPLPSTDITNFDSDVQHILREFDLTSPFALKLANLGYESIINIQLSNPDEIMQWTEYYDGTTWKYLNKMKRRLFLHTYMYIMKRITLNKEDPADIPSWTKADFDDFVKKLADCKILRNVLLADIECAVDALE